MIFKTKNDHGGKFRLFGQSRAGFSLVEAIIGIGIFLLVSVSIFSAYFSVTDLVRLSKFKIIATALANEQFEIIRNLPYEDVGILGGIPYGKLLHSQDIVRDGISFSVETTIRNIDDPFDGTIGGDPNDTSPADYKLAEVIVSCSFCNNFSPLLFSTYVGPRALETASTNGAIFIEVFDSAGLPIKNANVHIENNQENPAIIIDDETNNDGILQIVDAPPGVESYEITISKPGYSADRTYLTGDPINPNPVKPHSTVAVQQLTEVSFAIDKVSTLNIETVNQTCVSVGDIDFSLTGEKLIGTNPNVLKYNSNNSTDGAGEAIISGLEWDNYDISINTQGYSLAGTIPLLPFYLNPDSNQNLKLVVQTDDPNSLLVTVKDMGSQLPLSDATVRLTGVDYDNTLATGRGFLRQTDWSEGGGQENFVNENRYFVSDGNLEVSDPAGEIRLLDIAGQYAESGYLISSTFDTGSGSNFHQLTWLPQNQPPQTGQDSLKLQIATNNDQETWNFVGPDGTESSFYTVATPDINPLHDGDRYLRYKVFLSTQDTNFTPNAAEIVFTFTSECIPPGQVIFNGLDFGVYDIEVSKAGYTTFNDVVDINASWKEQEVILSP